MPDRELIERIDAHLERGNALFEEIREEIRLSREEREESRRQHEDLREFIREQRVLVQRSLKGFEQAIADMRDQLQANAAATWAMVDRLAGNGGATPAG